MYIYIIYIHVKTWYMNNIFRHVVFDIPGSLIEISQNFT